MTYDAQTNEEGNPGLTYSVLGPFGGIIHPQTGLFSWTPSAGQTGLQVFVITATDAAGNQSSQQLALSVGTLPNNSPIAVNDTAFTYADPFGSLVINVLANDSTPNVGEVLTIIGVTAPASGGTAVIADGASIIYRPAPASREPITLLTRSAMAAAAPQRPP